MPDDFSTMVIAFVWMGLGLAMLVGLRIVGRRFSVYPASRPAHAVRVLAGLLIIEGAIDSGFWLILIVGLAVYFRHIRTQQYALLAILSGAAERGVPLATAVEAFAQERRGWLGARARWMAEMLRAGEPLSEAIRKSRCLPQAVLPLVRLGEQTGQAEAALRQATLPQPSDDPLWQSLLPKLAYLLFVSCFATSVVIFEFLKIVPQFQKIFRDFGQRLPDLTQAVIAGGAWGGENWHLFGPLLLLLNLIFLYALGRYVGLFTFDLPGLGWMTRRLDGAAILDALALSAECGRPLTPGMATLAECYPKWRIRRRLRRALKETEGGGDWAESLERQNLLRSVDVAVLHSAARLGNLAWAMREMADSSRRRFTYHAQAAVQVAFPPVILLAGGFVFVFVVAMFLPLIHLIEALL